MSALVAVGLILAVAIAWLAFNVSEAVSTARLQREASNTARRSLNARLLDAGMNGGWVEGIAEPSNVVSLAEYRQRRAR